MAKRMVLLMLGLLTCVSFGAVSTHLSLDNRTGTRVAKATEQIRFSPAWESGVSAAAAWVSVNGEVVKTATAEGAFAWTPTTNGTYQFTHAVFMNGVQIGETLTATFVKGIEPRGCDWTTGTIELGWYADAKNLDAITYDIYWSESPDPASCVDKADHLVGTKVFSPSAVGAQELTFSDSQYLTHGDGLKPIYYHVVGTDGSRDFCKTRNRHGIFYGLGKYDKSKFPKLTEKENRGTSALKFAELMLKEGGMESGNAYARMNNEATWNNLTNDFASIARIVKNGDVFVFFCATHGGRNASGRARVCLYDEYLNNDGLAGLLKGISGGATGDIRSVAIVNVISACHSGGFFEADGAAEWFVDRQLAQCAPNVGWIASAGYDANSYAFEPYPVLPAFLLYYGWEKGWGGTGQYVTFGDLARYAKGMVHDLMYDEIKTEPQLEPELGGVLDAIRAGRRGSHDKLAPLSQLNVEASCGQSQNDVEVKWSGSASADGYLVFYDHIVNDNAENVCRAQTDFIRVSGAKTNCVIGDDVESSPMQHLQVHVKAYNGGEVSTSRTVDGWKDWPSTIKRINDALFVWIKKGANAIVQCVISATSYAAFAPGNIVIPETIDDCDVVEIARTAFAGNDGVTGVTIPSTVTNLAAGAFDGCVNLSSVTFRGEMPNGVVSSRIIENATKVYYPRAYAVQYKSVVPSELFAGYTDDVGEGLAIETEQLPSVMEMEEYEEQLECSGGTEPYWWSMDEADYLAVAEESTFAEVGEAQGWREDDGSWEYELPFPFLCCGREFKTVFVGDNANLEFEDDFGNYASITTGFGDLFSADAEQDIFVERAPDQVTFRWNRVKYSEPDNIVNYAVTLNSNGQIRCAFGACSDECRSVRIYGGLMGQAYSEQVGEDDIVFMPNYLPYGLSLSDDGIISGIPEQAGHCSFVVTVQDVEGEICSKRISIDVAANPNRPPQVENWDPVGDEDVCIRGGERGSFAVMVTDPNDDELTCRWYLDGEEIEGVNGTAFELVADENMRGLHWLTCEVTDGLWSVVAHEWSVCIGGELRVSAEDGADALQNALDEAVDGDVIYVGPGTYSPVARWNLAAVRVVATDGCESTVIDGNSELPCIQVDYNFTDTNRMVRFDGFTIQNGLADYGGGAQCAWLVGCVVRNNEAGYSGGGLYSGRADNCLFVGNSAEVGGGVYSSELYNCTVVDNTAADYDGGGINSCSHLNTIFWGNHSQSGWERTTVDDPLFVDADSGDYTLSELSPCVDAGSDNDVISETDLAGHLRIQGRAVDWGAYESPYSLSAPRAPGDLETYSYVNEIYLEWSEIANATFYKVYRVEEGLDDAAAEMIGTSYDWGDFSDMSVESGVSYRYWVVACNDAGESEKSESVTGICLDPLEIVDEDIPDGTVGMPYQHVFEARGGLDGSYSWMIPILGAQVENLNTFAKVGNRLDGLNDGSSMNYPLPFDFSIGGESVDCVEISAQGAVWIRTATDSYYNFHVYPVSDDYFEYPQITNVYVAEFESAVAFRWEGAFSDSRDPFDVSMTFDKNGCVRFTCSAETADLVMFEYSDNRCFIEYSASTGDVVLRPNALPPWLEIDESGLLAGTPLKEGCYSFSVSVVDDDWNCTTRKFSLKVQRGGADPIPDIGNNPTSEEVRQALEGSADSRLQANITDGENYNAYRAWARAVKNLDGESAAGVQAVRNAPFAWVSFATDSAALLAKVPTDDDLKVEEFKPSAMAGSFDFTVSVKDVTIGDKASVDNLKKLFGLEGAESLDTAAFSSENVSLDFKEPQDGKLKFSATPAVDNAKSFFMKVKVK